MRNKKRLYSKGVILMKEIKQRINQWEAQFRPGGDENLRFHE